MTPLRGERAVWIWSDEEWANWSLTTSQSFAEALEALGLEVLVDDRIKSSGNRRPDGSAIPEYIYPRWVSVMEQGLVALWSPGGARWHYNDVVPIFRDNQEARDAMMSAYALGGLIGLRAYLQKLLSPAQETGRQGD
jgi:hypothetical protein